MAKCGDNINHVHKLITLEEVTDVITVAYCANCKQRFYARPKDTKRYGELFKMNTLQPSGNLYYKYYGKMNTI